ncbi:hypothetical protein EW026_g4024 [Hermanssonia centrifuga]|uniref:Uncharacterized protein n=1 Tax=Hermanssonia centrifuga TaxID=98765 RepID=A0A4S4KN32_9APHY|nr:hypothetical protein EW026_g4024 [Hermanssonia centrifuga]
MIYLVDPVDLNTRPKEVEVANAVKYCHRVIAAYDAVNDQKPEVAVAAQNLEKAAPTLEKAAQTLEKAAQNLEKNFMTLINQALDDFKRDIIEEMKTSQEADINSSMDGLKAVIKQDMEEHFTKIGINLTEVKSDVKNLIHNIAVSDMSLFSSATENVALTLFHFWRLMRGNKHGTGKGRQILPELTSVQKIDALNNPKATSYFALHHLGERILETQ